MSGVVTRRALLVHGGRGAVCACGASAFATLAAPPSSAADPRWYQAAEAMRQLALSWGDQPYGAVLVLDGRIVGEGPSRVVKHNDANAHAEREAIRDAQRRLKRPRLERSVLVSTSRPCRACESAAADAGVARMLFGADLTDGGAPQARGS